MSIDTQTIQQQYKITDVLARYGHKPKIGRTKYCCPLHQEKDPSFSVKTMSDGSQRFRCHSTSCGKHGDVLQLVMELEGCDMPRAAEILTGNAPVKGKPAMKTEKAVLPQIQAEWGIVPRYKEPEWAKEPHKHLGKRLPVTSADGKPDGIVASLIHPYRDRDNALVCATVRIETRNGKAVIPLRYAMDQGVWYRKGYTDQEPTPLYGANRLVGNDLPVLVVEGEKVVDILQPILEGVYVVVCWLGGSGQVLYANWGELDGRDVTLWPDFDHLKPNQTERTGSKAMREAGELLDQLDVKRLRMIDITDFSEQRYKDGWDAADAVDPSDPNRLGRGLLTWIDNRAKPFGKRSSWIPEGFSPILAGPAHARYVKKDDVSNLWVLLNHHPQFKGRFAYDVFDQVAVVDDKVLDDAVISELRIEITQSRWPLTPRENDLRKTVESIAMRNRTNRFARQLMALQWDGKPRLQAAGSSRGLLVDYANCQDTPFNRVIGMRWMVGAAHRLMQDPYSTTGWQHDNVLVLEGEQGLRKTSFFRALGSVFDREVYTELSGSLGKDKDEMMKMRGKCIVELAEMSPYGRSDKEIFKGFIDRKVDEYRPPYGRDIIKQPRMVVFAGTTNKSHYLDDPTGARRFWPATVEDEIDTHRLKDDLEQIWAEAVHLARNGEPNHLQGEEVEWHLEAVDRRAQLEAWEERFDQMVVTSLEGFTLGQAFQWVGIMDATDMTPGATARLEALLTRKGYKYRQGSPNSPGQSRKWLWRLTQQRVKRS